MLIGGFQPFTLSDYPGQSAAIVFTQGCNFRCPYCHNRSLWPRSITKPPTHTTEKVLEFMSYRQGRLSGVVITGGEPTLQGDLSEFLQKLKRMGFSVKLDTNGSRPDVVAALLADGLVDYIAMDIKAPLEKYTLLCGRPVDTDAICRSITVIADGGLPFHFRTTFYRPLLAENDLAALKKILPSHAKHLTQAYREPLTTPTSSLITANG